MSDAITHHEGREMSRCRDCGMLVYVGEYHPFLACLAFRGCANGEKVRVNLAELAALRASLADERAKREGAERERDEQRHRHDLQAHAWGALRREFLRKIGAAYESRNRSQLARHAAEARALAAKSALFSLRSSHEALVAAARTWFEHSLCYCPFVPCDIDAKLRALLLDAPPAKEEAPRCGTCDGIVECDIPQSNVDGSLGSVHWTCPDCGPRPPCETCGGSSEIPTRVSFCPECENRSFVRDHDTVECDKCSWWTEGTERCPDCRPGAAGGST